MNIFLSLSNPSVFFESSKSSPQCLQLVFPFFLHRYVFNDVFTMLFCCVYQNLYWCLESLIANFVHLLFMLSKKVFPQCSFFHKHRSTLITFKLRIWYLLFLLFSLRYYFFCIYCSVMKFMIFYMVFFYFIFFFYINITNISPALFIGSSFIFILNTFNEFNFSFQFNILELISSNTLFKTSAFSSQSIWIYFGLPTHPYVGIHPDILL